MSLLEAEWNEREVMYQQQVSSLQNALKDATEEKEAAFSRLGEARAVCARAFPNVLMCMCLYVCNA